MFKKVIFICLILTLTLTINCRFLFYKIENYLNESVDFEVYFNSASWNNQKFSVDPGYAFVIMLPYFLVTNNQNSFLISSKTYAKVGGLLPGMKITKQMNELHDSKQVTRVNLNSRIIQIKPNSDNTKLKIDMMQFDVKELMKLNKEEKDKLVKKDKEERQMLERLSMNKINQLHDVRLANI